VWDAESGKELLTLNGRRGTVKSVAWSPDGKRLAAASDDGTVQVYAMDIRLRMGLTHQRFAAHPSEDGCKKYFHIEKCSPFPELSWWYVVTGVRVAGSPLWRPWFSILPSPVVCETNKSKTCCGLPSNFVNDK
jgi:WD40 repeat protein